MKVAVQTMIKLLPTFQVQALDAPLPLARLLHRVNSAQNAEKKHLGLWASGLPHCPLAFWYEAHGRPCPDRRTFDGDMTFSLGSAIHTTLQRWLPGLWGNWSCHRCAERRMQYVQIYHHCFEPEPCPRHGRRNYDEIHLMRGVLSGRPDALVCPSLDLSEGLHVVELKSTRKWPVEEATPAHVEQANFYAGAVQDTLGLRVPTLAIHYRNSRAPSLAKTFYFEPDYSRYQYHVAMADQIQEIVRQDEPPAGLCDFGGDYGYCGYAPLCRRRLEGGPEGSDEDGELL